MLKEDHGKVPHPYMEMIRRFPLRPIRNDADCDAATKILDKYFGREDLDAGTEDYIFVLVGLVKEYEKKYHPVDRSSVTPLSMLKHLMEANEMTTADLGRRLGSSGLG